MNLLIFFCSIIFIFFCKEPNMQDQQIQELQQNVGFRKLELQTTDSSSSDFLNLSFAGQMLQVINAQNMLIIKLLQRQTLLCQEICKRSSSSNSSSGSENKPGEGSKVSGYRDLKQEQISSGSPIQRDPYITKNNVKIIQKEGCIFTQNKVIKNNSFEDESNSSVYEGHSNSNDIRDAKPNFKKKITQTKNMIKNFGKAIFNYIRKNKEKRNKVLSYLGISDSEFMRVFDSLRGHVLSLSQLRNLWTPQGNIYHKAFRILSCDYLRKNCLYRTFNSRVENYQVHMKYRQRLIQGIKSPQQFTILKTS